MLVAEVVVKFDNAVIAETRGSDRTEEVVQRSREPADDVGGPETHRADRRRCAQQNSRQGARSNRGVRTVRGRASWGIGAIIQECRGLSDPSRGRLRGQTGEADAVLLALECQKEKCLIFKDWSAQRAAPVLIAQRGLLLARARRKERRRGAKKLVAIVIVGRAVKVVAAGLQDNVHCTAGIASRLGAGLRLR